MGNIREFAFKKHREVNQKYGEYDYSFHLEGVVNIIKEFLSSYPSNIKLIKIAYLHDVLEDTNTTVKELENLTTSDIVDIVKRLTDKEGKNRKERHLNTYYLIREKEDAVLVKLADRIFNIRHSIKTNKNKGSMYLKEADSFKSALFDPRHKYARILWEEYDKQILKLKK